MDLTFSGFRPEDDVTVRWNGKRHGDDEADGENGGPRRHDEDDGGTRRKKMK